MRRKSPAVPLLAVALLCAASAWAGWMDKVKKAASDTVDGALKTRDERRKKVSTKSHAGIRGLDEDEQESSEADPRDFEGLQWLESLEIGEDEVDRFIQEGGLTS